jgi:hypothetical protein
MIANNSPLTKIDQDAELRRVLAKVYGLLLRLAEEAENRSIVTNISDGEKTDKEITTPMNISNQQADSPTSQQQISP